MAKAYRLPLQHVRKKLPPVAVAPTCIIVIVVILFLLPPFAKGANFPCGLGQFQCKDGSCILQEKMCDGRHDCLDGTDELDCDYNLCRKPHWFQCKPQGPCLSSELICNGVENCPGGEDEDDCVGHWQGDAADRAGSGTGSSADVGTGGWYSSKRSCTIYEYTCQTDKSCIPLDFMCDGKTHCLDGSDEVDGCVKAKTKCRGFFCDNKKCLESKKWVCDGVDDCGDGSDERKCGINCKLELGKFFCHDNSSCLELPQVCNGKPDCADGSDESSRCNATQDNCSTKTCPPAAKCQMLPDSSPVCICPRGFRLSTLQNACVDINECLENYGLCSQHCENTVGSYRCACDENYVLRADNRTCATRYGDALMFYSTQIAVMGLHMRSNRVYTIAKNLTKIIGVAYDGEFLYWTNIQNEAESIVKSTVDGKQQEILLTSGLDAPEDLAVDWLTGNIYFSDNIMRHIAVCSNDGLYCAVLVVIDVHQPRGVALWPQRAQIFWTDWGVKPMIARASMDGSHSLPIVTENIHWPNGITLDMHNNRLYWVDAKLATIESCMPDGSDRRMVFDEILKHPYGLSIFEDKVYWSDWGTKSIHTCNKFTGKDHQIVTKDRTIYAVHIYHPAKQPKSDHACMKARCSHLCLLAENNSFSCTCPDGMQLGADQLHCIKTHKRQRLFIALKNTLLEMEHTTFGRHMISLSHQLSLYISEMVYNSVNGSIIIADNFQHSIYEYDLMKSNISLLVHNNVGNITGLAFDHLAHNVYWTDAERHVVEVFSLRTRQRAIVSFFYGIEVPIGLSIIPEDGNMFIALRARKHVHIDQIPMNGQGEHIHAFEDELGDNEFKFAPDFETKTLYWSDSALGRISFSDYRNLHDYTFRGRLRRPFSIALVNDDIFWSELRSSTLHWTHKSNLGPTKRVEIEVAKDTFSYALPARIPLLASTPAMLTDHPCQHRNGGCSHVCVTLSKFAGGCLCPAGLVFRDSSNLTCIEALDCEFRCHSGECLTQSRRCNGRKDCPDGSDEVGCDPLSIKHRKVICGVGEFMCHDATQCIQHENRCDGQKDCRDGSDEQHCDKYDKSKLCHRHQHACDNGNCVDFSAMCDGIDDCGDHSDETNCQVTDGKDVGSHPMCAEHMFQCNSGTCIAKSWECDGKIDCTDGSDEHEKCGLKECPPQMHKCLLGQCIDMRLVCDGHNDCGDHSDEYNCDSITGKQHEMTCGDDLHPMYQCPSAATVCLELSAKCNGTAECPRGEDEADCGAICSMYEFQCKSNNECIRMEFRCDHDKDCTDGSDELNCDHLHNRTVTTMQKWHERACKPHMFDCKDGQCVEMSRVCNNFPDCETGADEGPLCETACKPSSRPICDHKCRPTPAGAACSCFSGYKLDDDKRSCLDINECDEYDPCAQLCENTHGSYRCACYPDFMLRPDKTTCKSIESQSALMFSTYNEVRSMTEQPITLRVVWAVNDSKINGFDINVRERLAYFSTDAENVLYMVNMTDGVVKMGLAVDAPSKVAVDWITDNVYVISRAQQYEIKVCSFAHKMCGRVAQADPRETIRALAVDALNRYVFYVNVRAQSFQAPLSQINIARLDGKKREMLLTKSSSYITALSSDPYKRLLYYVDMHTQTLQAISYKEGGTRNPITLIQKGNVIMHPSGLSIYENQAFIVNIGAKEAVRCNLYGTRDCKAFNLNILNAEDVVVDGVSRQPLASNPCDMAHCNGMCVQSEYGYECMCGNAIVLENVICPKDASNAILSSALLIGSTTADDSTSHASAALTLTLLFVALLAAGVGYMLYRRVKQGHRDFNINLHFQNPISKFTAGKSASMQTDSIDGAFGREHEKMRMGAPIYRFLRGSKGSIGSEILLETARESETLAQSERETANIIMESEPDYDTTRTGRHYADDDDARAKLVP